MTDARPRSLSPRARWAVPGVVAAAVAAAFVAPPLLASAGQEGLPDVTAEELVLRVASAEPQPLSGTVVYTARLGLPDLGFTEMTGADPIALLGGSSTLRVWTDGAERSRVALLGSTSEWSVVTDGPSAWTYSSADEEVVHYRLDEEGRALWEATRDRPEVLGDLPTPQEAARRVLDRVEEHSTVSLDAVTTVAGRPAYQLVVVPRTDGTLVSRVVVAVDAETATPLRVQTWGVHDDTVPALEIGHTDVTFAVPDDAVLAFSTPAGATVREVEVPLPEPTDMSREDAHLAMSGEGGLPDGVTVVGDGWDAVTVWTGVDVPGLLAGDPGAVATLPGSDRLIGTDRAQDLVDEFVPGDRSAPGAFRLDLGALYDELTVAVPEGRLLESALLTVLVTEDGRVLAGAVPAAVLRDLA